MKNLFILALILLCAVMPVFAEVRIGGEFDYYMVNGFDSDNAASFADKWDKGELDFRASAGDCSRVLIEIEEDGSWDEGKGTSPEGTPSINYFRVQTDWGKFFGLEETSINTDIGLYSYQTFDRVHFTGFGYEYSENFSNPYMPKDFGFKLSLSFLGGLLQPYYTMSFDTVQATDNKGKATPDGEATYMIGSGFDFKSIGLPLWLEAYFMKGTAKDANQFGIEAMYDLAVGGMKITFGGFYLNFTKAQRSRWSDRGADSDDRGALWGFGTRLATSGFAIDITGAGQLGEDYYGKGNYSPFSVLAVDAEYFFLNWLGLNAGTAFAFGDYKELSGDKTLQSIEAGVVVKPSRGVLYKVGYIYVDKDVAAGPGTLFRTLNTKKVTAEKGGLYFTTKIDF